MKITKKILSMILVGLTVLGLLPATVFGTQPKAMTLDELRAQYGAITIEAYNLGQGFLVEPTLYAKAGKSVGDITVEFLTSKALSYQGNTSYFSGLEFDDTLAPAYPEYLAPYLSELEQSGDGNGYLAEFDYSGYAGWCFTINDWWSSWGADSAYPGKEIIDYNTQEAVVLGDVIRWHFTVYGYGADCGFPGNVMAQYMGGNLFEQEDKTELIFILAAINNYYGNLSTDNVYETALAVAADPLATANEIAAQEAALRSYIDDHFLSAQPEEDPTPEYVPDSKLDFSMSITVGAEMQVVYTVLASKVSSYESFYLEVSKNVVGGDPVVTTYGLDEDMSEMMVLTNASGKISGYHATYTGINAKEMGDEFTATLYAVAANGTIYYSNANTNSIKSFLMGKITDTVSPATLKTLAVDMLNYGAAAQLNFSYNAENLVNADLTDEQKALGTQTLPEAVDSTVITGDGINLTASVTVKSKVELTLTCMYKTADASNVKFVFKDKDGKVLAELAPSNHIANKAVQCVYDQVGAKQMRQLITIEVYDGDTLVSKTLTWSIESYVASTLAKTSTSEILANMVNAMLIYGDSAAIYLRSNG